MSARVSVDAAALRQFIDNAEADCETVIREFCCSLAEDETVRREFNESVAALDIREIEDAS